MKILVKILFFLSFNVFVYCNVYFDFSPININFRGIESNDETIIIYGDYGSMIISFDNMLSWEKIRIFQKGGIENLFIEDNRTIAFSDSGEIAVTIDKKNWKIVLDIDDTIISIVKYSSGYFIRTYNNLITISDSFEIQKIYPFVSATTQSSKPINYHSSITTFKENLIVESNKSVQYIFDTNLNLIDTIDYSDFIDCNYCWGKYQIFGDSNYFYNVVDKTIYRTKDFKSIEEVYRVDQFFYMFIINNSNVYFINRTTRSNIPYKSDLFKVIDKDSIQKIISINNYNLGNNVSHYIEANDYLIKDDALIIVGKWNLLFKVNFNDNILNIISDFSGHTSYTNPDYISDSTFLFYSGYYYGLYNPYIYNSTDRGITIKPTVEIAQNPTYKELGWYDFKYFDSQTKTLFFIGYNTVTGKEYKFISEDFGKSFKTEETSGFSLRQCKYPYGNIQKKDSQFVTVYNYRMSNKYYSQFLTLSNNLVLQSKFIDSNMFVYYVHSKDTNSYHIHCFNSLDSLYEIKYTENKGQSWNIIKEYSYLDSFLYYIEFEYKNKPVIGIFNYNKADSIITLEIFDIEKKAVYNLYSHKIKKLYYESLEHSSLTYSNDTIFISIEDTLFYSTELYDKTKWKYYLFPNNGFIKRTFKKFNDVFYARYQDDIHLPNVYWINIREDIIKPKPAILVEDIDFGKHGIGNNESLNKTIKIYNNSDDADLIINGYSDLRDSAFSTNLPEITVDNPLLINPQNYFEFEAYFKPSEVKKYSDSIVFFSNAFETDSICHLIGEGIDDTTSVNDYYLNSQNYLYCFPPYPVPTSNQVRSLIYWDTSLDIENDDIAVYDIFGNKVAGREKITIDKQNAYSGILTWNCTNVPDGIYLIRIIHGTKTWTMKVIVSK